MKVEFGLWGREEVGRGYLIDRLEELGWMRVAMAWKLVWAVRGLEEGARKMLMAVGQLMSWGVSWL